jgi:hypothetical protein
LSRVLLERFHIYISRLPPGLADRTVDEANRLVLGFITALAELDRITFDTALESKDQEDDEEIELSFTKRQSQKQRKAESMLRARRNTATFDPRVFMQIDFDVPTNPNEVAIAEICLLDRLNDILQVRSCGLQFKRTSTDQPLCDD